MSSRKKQKANIFGSLLVGFLVVLGLYLYFGNTKTKASWFDDAWRYRVAIPISAHTSAETSVYVSLTGTDGINTTDTTKFQSDCGDIRFVNEAGEILPYYLTTACGLSQTGFQVFLENFPAGAQTIYYYYGNPSAPNGFSSASMGAAATGVTLGTRGSEVEAPSSPMVYFRFDEGFGQTISNSMETVNNGTLGPDATVTATDPTWRGEEMCVAGKCLEFESTSSQYVNAANTIGSVNSVSFWVKPTSTTTSLMVLNGVAGNASISVSSGTISAGAGFTSPTIYVNGVVKSTLVANEWQYVTITTATGISASNIMIGRVNTSYLDGFVDEFKLFGSVLDSSQVKSGYATGLAKSSSIKNSVASLGGGGAAGPMGSGLVGYWKMDENASTSLSDKSGNNNTGVLTNSPTWSIGRYGSGVNFGTGTTNKYVSIANSSSIDQLSAFTWSFWVNPALLQDNMIMSKSNALNVYFENISSSLRVQVFMQCTGNDMTAFSTSADSLVLNSWNHVVVSYSGNGCGLDSLNTYVNGKLASKHANSVSGTGTRDTEGSQNLIIGNNSAFNDQVEGAMDEVRIYNRNLSFSEVLQLYNFAPDPINWWKLDENSGQSFQDFGSSMLSGTVGSTSSVANDDPTWVAGKYGSALFFDGVDDDARVADNDLLSFGGTTSGTDRPYTFEMWVNPTNNISHFFLDKSGEYEMRLGSDGRLICKQKDSSSGAYIGRNYGAGIPVNSWHHVACSYDGSGTSAGTKIYLDGVRVDNSNEQSGAYVAMENLGNAFHLWDSVEPWYGKIDDVRIYNYVRTDVQIVEGMNSGKIFPLSYWKFDEGYGTKAYDSGYGNNEAYLYDAVTPCPGPSGCPSWTNSGRVGKALNFDGVDDGLFVSVNDDFDEMRDDLSISTWVKADTIDNGEYIIHHGETGSELEVDNDLFFLRWNTTSGNDIEYGHEYGAGNDEYYVFDTNLSVSTWYHVVLVRDSKFKSLTLYINGKRVSQTNYTNAPTGGTGGEMEIGANDDNSGNYFDGVIDEFKIYAGVIEQDQIYSDYISGYQSQLGASGTDSTGLVSLSNNDTYCPPGQGSVCVGPVAHWKLNENNGTSVYDSSGNNLTGTLGGTTAPSWDKGIFGGGVKFYPPSNSKITVTDNSLLRPSAMTAEAWFNVNTISPSYQSVLDKGWNSNSAWSVYIETGTKVWFSVKNSAGTQYDASYTLTIVPNTWYHVAATFDGSNISIYVNGVKGELSSTVAGTGFLTNTSDFVLSQSGSFPLNGIIDDVRIYNYARTLQQIAWDYNNGAPVGQFKMDECQGSTLYDSINSANSAAITIGATGTQTAVGTCAVNATTARYTGREGKVNSALNFDGTDDYAVRTGTALPTGDFTYTAWVSRAATGNAHTILKVSPGDGTNELKFSITASDDGTNTNKLRFATNGNSTYSATQLSQANTWYHVAIVRSGSTKRMYINGVLDSVSGTDATALSFGSCNMYIGSSPGSGCAATFTEGFNGKIDDLRIYNYALNATQIKNVMNDGAVKLAPVTGSPN